MAGEPDSLHGVESDRDEEEGRSDSHETQNRISPVVLSFSNAGQQGKYEAREQQNRGCLEARRQERHSAADRVERERLSDIAQNDAAEHQPEREPRGTGTHAPDTEDTRKRVVGDTHQEERSEAENLGVAVDLTMG